MKKFFCVALACLALVHSALGQRPMRFSLLTDILDLTNCVAQPGNVPIPLGPTNLNIEILNWATKLSATNQPGEFLLQLKRPTMIGSLIQYGGGEVSYRTNGEWRQLPPVLETGRKLQTVAFPFGESISALKITVPAQKQGGQYQAILPFLTLLPVRAINVAVSATASASSVAGGSRPEALIDGIVDSQSNFSTVPRKTISATDPEWVMLTWPEPVRFRGIGLFRGSVDAGAGALRVETFSGSADPTLAGSTNQWVEVFTRSTLPSAFRSNQFFVAMEMQETRALRLSATGGVDRIGLGEIVVFQDLGAAPVPARITSQERKTYTIAKAAPNKIIIDGNDDDWPAERIDGFGLQYDETNLYVFFKGKDPDATFENKGTNFIELFHTGDALDVMLQTKPGRTPGRLDPAPGDIRLLFAMFQGKPVCVLYNYRVTDFLSQPVMFKAGDRDVWSDVVQTIKEARVELKRGQGEFSLEAAVPLKAIQLLPAAVPETRGDVGRVFSDTTGSKAVRREYWSNKDAAPIGDLGTEVMVQPAYWGVFKFAE